MLPDASRAEVVERTRRLASLVEAALPKQIDHAPIPSWPTLSASLMARIAGQARSIATLLEGEHELDARMVMRSMLEHVTLLAWLAIDSDEPSRTGRARNPDDNTGWWLARQLRNEERLHQGRHQAFGGFLNEDVRAGIREYKHRLKPYLDLGGFPKPEELAGEVDAHWATRIPGWVSSAPQEPDFLLTFRGLYWALYTIGNASTHPSLGPLTQTFLSPLSYFNETKARVHRERTTETVDVFSSIATFLLGYAIGLSDRVFGWPDAREAHRILDRFDEVYGPIVFLETVAEILDGREGRRFGDADGTLISIEVRDGGATLVTLDGELGWTRLRHQYGESRWTYDAKGIEPITAGPRLEDHAIAAIVAGERLLRTAHWRAACDDPPANWATDAP